MLEDLKKEFTESSKTLPNKVIPKPFLTRPEGAGVQTNSTLHEMDWDMEQCVMEFSSVHWNYSVSDP